MALNVATLVARVVADTSAFNAGMAGVEGRLASTGAAMRNTGRALTTSLTLPLVAAAAAGVKFAIDFQSQMTLVHTQAGASASEVERMTKAVLQLAPATVYGPTELAKALYHIESVGARGADALNILHVAAEGAAVGHADLEATASALAGTMRVFHIPASQAAQVMGDLNAVVGAGNMRMQELNNAIGTGLLPTAAGLGLNIREVGAALAVMTDESTPAQVAATRMRTLLLLMSGETKKSRDTLAELGIGALDLGHKLQQPGGFVPALMLLKEHLDKIPDSVKRTQILAEAFGGARSSGTIIQLLNNLDFVQKKYDQINRTAANFPRAVIATQATDAYKLHQAWAAVQTVLTQAGGLLAPFVIQIAQAISRAALAFEGLSKPIQEFIVYGSMVVAALGPVIWIMGTVIATVEALAGVFAAIFTPVGLVIAAIAGLGIAFVEIYRHSEAFRESVARVFDTLQSSGAAVVSALRNVFSALGGVLSGQTPTWQHLGQVASEVMGTIRSIVQTVASFVVQEFQSMAGGIRAHTAEIQAFLRTAWSAISAIFRVTLPIIEAIVKTAWNVIRIVIETAMKVIGNIILAVMDVISGNWSGAWNAIKAATGALLHGIVALIGTILRGAITLALAEATAIGHAIWAGIHTVIGLLGKLAGDLMAKIGAVIHQIAAWAVGQARAIGESIASGIVSGVSGLAGSLAGKLKGEVGGALHSIGGFIRKGSPSKLFAEEIGKPIGEGIVQGYLDGIRDLPTKMSSTLRNALEHAKQVVDAQRQKVQTAFQRMADYAMRAFDGATQSHLNEMQTKYEAMIKEKITDPMNAALKNLERSHQATLDAISGRQSAATPTEAVIAGMQDQHAEEQRQQQIADARKSLSEAQAGDDPNAIISAQRSLNDALYEETLAGLQKQAAVEREAAATKAALDTQAENDAYDTTRQGIEDTYAALEAGYKATYDQQVLNYQSQRDLQRQHLEDMLTELEAKLEKHPELWTKEHAKIMALFKKVFGPDYKTAGRNLGVGFAQGLRESFGAVSAAAHDLAQIVANALKLNSPAKEGPLSTLDTWWTEFAPTLLSGLDTRAISAAVTGAATPGSGAALGTGAGAAGSRGQGDTYIQVTVPGATFLSGDRAATRELADTLVPEIRRQLNVAT